MPHQRGQDPNFLNTERGSAYARANSAALLPASSMLLWLLSLSGSYCQKRVDCHMRLAFSTKKLLLTEPMTCARSAHCHGLAAQPSLSPPLLLKHHQGTSEL